MFGSLTFIKDSVAAAGTALLLAAAAMLSQQDPVAASALSGRAAPDAREITVVATRFTFEPARIEVAEGERVRLILKSGDGVHGIEVKKFKVHKKVPRGGEVTIEFVASAAGEFPILCSEYCGEGHGDMKGTLIVIAKSVSPK